MAPQDRPLSTVLPVQEASVRQQTAFPVEDYDLSATLCSGQVFRWQRHGDSWVGVVRGRWVRLWQEAGHIFAETAVPQTDWRWLADYLQVEVNLAAILDTFPLDSAMSAAVQACRGLRLLRQDVWECLASFILSSTKQIVQIQQVISTLALRWGQPLTVLPGEEPAFTFPTAVQLADASERDLRSCKMGFRAPYLLASARMIADGRFNLEALRDLPISAARVELMKLPGVGTKIADCVLLFAYGFPEAFPVDVWMLRVLKRFHFRRRRVQPARLHAVAQKYFGPNAGYAQQYLFHWIRTNPQNELPV